MNSRSTRQTPLRRAAERVRQSPYRVVFDSGLVAVDDPRVIAVHAGYDDLVKVFAAREPVTRVV